MLLYASVQIHHWKVHALPATFVHSIDLTPLPLLNRVNLKPSIIGMLSREESESSCFDRSVSWAVTLNRLNVVIILSSTTASLKVISYEYPLLSEGFMIVTNAKPSQGPPMGSNVSPPRTEDGL